MIDRIAGTRGPPFPEGEWQQAEQRGSAGERLVDGIGELELLAACEREQTVATSFVGEDLKIGEECGNVLDLIDDGAFPNCDRNPRGSDSANSRWSGASRLTY